MSLISRAVVLEPVSPDAHILLANALADFYDLRSTLKEPKQLFASSNAICPARLSQ